MRTCSCQIRERNGIREVNEIPKEFTATVTPFGHINSEVKSGVEADAIVKQYFDESIYSFYFFDGEKLENYFDAIQATMIKQSIFNISQISLLTSVLKRLEVLEKEAQKRIGKGAPDLQKKLEEEQGIEDEIIDCEKKMHREKEDEQTAYDKVKAIQAQINLVKPGEDLLKRKESILNEIAGYKKALESLDNDRSAFIRRYMTLLPLYPDVHKVIELIESKFERGEIPPHFDKEIIQRMIDGKEKNCPICAREVNQEMVVHLEHLLEQISVSTSTSNLLSSIRSTLFSIKDEVLQYPVKRDELQQKRQEIIRKKNDAQKRLEEVKGLLGNETTSIENKGPTVASLTEKMKPYERDMGFHHDQAIRFEERINTKKQELENLKKEIESLQEKAKTNVKLQKEFQLYSELRNQFSRVRDSITGRMRAEIERHTTEIFMNMATKQHTFGRVSIDDEYHITVYDNEGIPMTPNLSDTETMSLAYAFTLAIHKASGKNCPLVIDSPLGKTSDENRKNMTSTLLEISRNKQLIMCFTPDEYSENIHDILENVDKRELKLGEDETTIETGLVVE